MRFSSALSGPGRPRLSQREKASREIQRHKARLAELGVIEKEMGQEEVEALNAQIDALTATIDSLKSEYSRIKSQKDEELKSWFDDRIKTLVNSQLVELENQRRETLRTLDDRIHEASERLRGLKSEIRDQSQQRDAIIKETGDLGVVKTRFDNYRSNTESELSDLKAFRSQMLEDLKILRPMMDYYFGQETPTQRYDFFRREFRDKVAGTIDQVEEVFRRFYDLVKEA
jgi:prefoldin subunit 5